VAEGGLAGEEVTAESIKPPFACRTPPKTPSGAGIDSTPIAEVAICTPAVETAMRRNERDFVTNSKNKSEFRFYRFDMPCGSDTGNPFNDATELQTAIAPTAWPKRIEINVVHYGVREYPIVGWYTVDYGKGMLQRGDSKRMAVETLSMDLSQGEFITKSKLAAGNNAGNVSGVIYVEFETSQGRVESVGDAHGHHIIEVVPPAGFLGLKGFYGCHGGAIDRMGVIWGKIC